MKAKQSRLWSCVLGQRAIASYPDRVGSKTPLGSKWSLPLPLCHPTAWQQSKSAEKGRIQRPLWRTSSPNCMPRAASLDDHLTLRSLEVGFLTNLAVSGNPGVLDCAPHLECMLYDNAQLARVYLHVWQVTDNEVFRTI